jgi:branched-chain amino acid transport system substrate-binding protein
MKNITPFGKKYIEEFTEASGRLPGYAEYFCGLQAHLMKAAIEKADSTDREKIRDALSNLNATDPITGLAVEFDQNGARKSSVAVMQIESVEQKSYKAKELFDINWNPDVLPVCELAK